MKTRTCLLISAFLLVFVCTERLKSGIHRGSASRESSYLVMDNWSIRKVKNGVQVCTRWIITSGNVKTRQVKAEIIIPGKREKLVRYIIEEELARKWMVFLDELHYYRDSIEQDQWLAYGRIDALGKLACFDVVTDNRIIQNFPEGMTTITMDGVPGQFPDKSGVYRISGLHTSWQLKTLPDDQTKLVYMLHTEMRPVVPVWLTDPVVTGMLILTLCQLRDVAGQSEK